MKQIDSIEKNLDDVIEILERQKKILDRNIPLSQLRSERPQPQLIKPIEAEPYDRNSWNFTDSLLFMAALVFILALLWSMGVFA